MGKIPRRAFLTNRRFMIALRAVALGFAEPTTTTPTSGDEEDDDDFYDPDDRPIRAEL